jgi:N-acetylneuraminate synthase
MKNTEIFDELFVLEMANNHWGKVDRGLKIIDQFSKIVRFNNIRAAIKLQFRDVDKFVHSKFRNRTDIRYIKKTVDTRMRKKDLATLVAAIRESGCIPSATPFDEASVDLCEEFDLPFIKLASSDVNDWFLIERIAKTKKPVIASSGGTSVKDLDDLVSFFSKRFIPLGLNHCVSLYPTPHDDLELNQIDYLLNRYPGNTIGFSSHQYRHWDTSLAIAYAKGARTFERHIDIEEDGLEVSTYCSTPKQIDQWFGDFNEIKAICGGPGNSKRKCKKTEIDYLDSLIRGVYAKEDLAKGSKLQKNHVYLAIPLQKSQISTREFMEGLILTENIKKDQPITIKTIETPYKDLDIFNNIIANRGC